MKTVHGDLPLDFNWNSDSHRTSLVPKRIILAIIIICLIFILLGALSFRFLNLEVQKTLEEDPTIMAQYELKLNIDQFRQLKNQLNNK